MMLYVWMYFDGIFVNSGESYGKWRKSHSDDEACDI